MEKKQNENEKNRSKLFLLLLYPEDPILMSALDFIKANYDYALIYQDKDVYLTDTETNGVFHAEGTLKKGHYHVVVRFKNARYLSGVAKELGIAENYLRVCHNFKRSLLYLIHHYEPEKYQYPASDVEGTLKNVFLEFLHNEGKTESEKVLDIFAEIDSCEFQVDFMVFVKRVAHMGYWDVLRRSSSIILRYIDCHNQNFKV